MSKEEKEYKQEDMEKMYNYIKLLLASQILFEMQTELRGTKVFNGKIKNAAHIIKKQSQYLIEKDIEQIFNRDDKVANEAMSSIEAVAKKLSSLNTHKLANLNHILNQVDNENLMLIDRDYYEELEKTKTKYNKL